MKLFKKIGLLLGAIVLSVSVAGLVFASNDTIQLIVNGKRIDADVAPEVKEGRTLVPIRWVAEALGANVHWDAENRAVEIEGGSINGSIKDGGKSQRDESADRSLQEQLTMLERYFVAETPLAAVETWAEGVKSRNGAVQFAMLSPDLQQQARSAYERIHWVTGISSPYVSSYSIVPKDESDWKDGIQKYYVEFQMATSTGNAGLESATLWVKEQDGRWVITQVLGGTEGVPNFIPEDLYTDDPAIRQMVNKLKLGLSEAEVKDVFGDNYVEVVGAMAGEQMWRYDFVGEEDYQFETESFDGVFIDSVDRDGIINGSMRMQLFITWSERAGQNEVESYALYYRGHDGNMYNFRLYADGKIQLK